MQANYLAKWLNDELTDEELTAFEQSDEYTSYVRIREATSNWEAPEYHVEAALDNFKGRHKAHRPKVLSLRPFKMFLRVAAAVAVLLTGSYFYMNSLVASVSTEYAQKKSFTLPDTSEVTLNAASEISYSEKNWDEKRAIDLNGEAFFKVAKGRRFTVTTEHGTVAVLGTQFNVEDRENFFEVTCFEGLVSVVFNGQESKLSEGNSLVVINGKLTKTNVNVHSVPSWMNDESSFKSIPLKFVLAEFERQHNITVETQNVDTDQLFTGTFSNTDTDLAVQSISVPSRIKFKFEGNKVLFYAENAP